MTNAEFVAQIKREDCNPDLQLIWDCAGESTVRALLENAAGLRVYIPKPTSFPTVMNRVIRELAKTHSTLTISKQLNISPWLVKQHLSGKGKIISVNP